MQTEFNEIASIEAFLDGTLANEEKDAFETWRKQDPASESKIKAQHLLRDGMYALAVESYKEQLREWNEADKHSKEIPPKRNSRIVLFGQDMPRWIPLAVVAVLICFLVWMGNDYADRHYSDEVLARSNYIEPDYPEGHTIGEIDLRDCPDVLRSEIRGSRQGLLLTSKPELALLFFKGHCLFKTGDYLGAAADFEQVLNQELISFDQSPNAFWHLILALIAGDQVSDEHAIQLLEKLPVEASSELRGKADALRKDLESGWRWIAS